MLLGVSRDGLLKALSTRTRHTPDGAIVSPLDPKAAADNRDSLAKTIYAKMFDWLVARINAAIGEDKACAASVGVLDIYGFESFKTNDFEQFCINLANEKLQQHFNQHVFKMEQAEYEREKIDWSYIQFVDNQDVLDLIEGRMGVLDLLDEQCKFPTSTGADMAQKLYSTQTVKDSKRFSKPKTSNTAFTIDHYAGSVMYETMNFLDKNKDFVVAEHQSLLSGSAHSFMAALFTEPAEPAAPAAGGKPAFKGFKFNSVGSQFKKQLAELMAALHVMEPHYIRCIKPNSFNKPMAFENVNVLHQLRCGGVLEAVRISCAGFPSKRPFPDFVDHFWPLAPELLRDSSLDDRDITREIINRANITDCQLGATKVFLRAGGMALLDKMRTDCLNGAAKTIQRYTRGWLAVKAFKRTKAAVLLVQCAVRARTARLVAAGLRAQKAALTIQRVYRGHRARVEYATARQAVLLVQSIWRGRNARDRFAALRRHQAALQLQAAWRMRQAQAAFREQVQAALTIQCALRCKDAKHQLWQLRQEAREGRKLLEDKKALEARVQELQATLAVVQDQRNELRQQAKDHMVALSAVESKLVESEAARAAAETAAAEAAASGVEQERAAREAAEQEVATLKAELAAAADAAAKAKVESERKLATATDYISRQLNERSDIEKKFHSMKDDLITRLQNACAQRDDARAQVLELQNELEKLREALVVKDRALAAAAPHGLSGAAAAGLLTPQANGAGPSQPSPLITSMQRAPGYAKSMYDQISTSLGLATPGAAGAPGTPGMPMREDMRSPLVGTPGMMGTPGSAGPPGPESELERKARELAAKQHALLMERRKAEEERLLSALATNMGFSKGRPVAALVIFRCCIQWKAFQADRTTLFDRIIGVIGTQIEQHQDDNEHLAYWLSNTVVLLHMLHKNIKPASGGTARKSAPALPGSSGARSVFGNLFARNPSPQTHAEASIHGAGVGGFKQVEAKYPALLFKQQLDAFVQKIFPMMRDNVKKAITSLLANCMHFPKGHGARPARAAGEGGAGLSTAGSAGLAANMDTRHKSWTDILAVFDTLLVTLKANAVPRVLVQALFKQLFSFINVNLFNQLLLRRESCSFSNGEHVQKGLSQVETWIQGAGAEWVGDSSNELRCIRQAVTFLVIGNKARRTLDDITADLCPALSIQQLYRISTMYFDDKYNTETVNSTVLSEMKQKMSESNSTASHSFLLDDDSTLPFAAAEVLIAMDDKELYTGLPLPDALRDPPTAQQGAPAASSTSTMPDGTSGPAGQAAAAPMVSVAAGFAFLERELRLGQPSGGGSTAGTPGGSLMAT